MDLIEVLWKQDVDLGFSLELQVESKNTEKPDEKSEFGDGQNPESPGSASLTFPEDDIEKLKALKEVNDDSVKVSYFYNCLLVLRIVFVLVIG